MISLRIDEESIRFRITLDDLEALLDGDSILQRVTAGAAFVESAIVPVWKGDMNLDLHEARFTLSVPHQTLEQLRDLGRSKNGISVQQGEVEISLQIDLKTQPKKVG